MVGVQERDIKSLKDKYQITPVNLRPVEPSLVYRLDIISIPQHPEGKPKRFNQGKVCKIELHFIHYDADTSPGSSGSPVFFSESKDYRVLALHKGSISRDGGLVNRGIFINAILSDANDGEI